MLILTIYQPVKHINIEMLMDCNKQLELPHIYYGF